MNKSVPFYDKSSQKTFGKSLPFHSFYNFPRLKKRLVTNHMNIYNFGSQAPHPPSPVDDEFHFLVQCPLFSNERKSFFEKLGSIMPSFPQLSLENKFKTIVCPTSAKAAKLANRFIQLMFNTRSKIDQSN